MTLIILRLLLCIFGLALLAGHPIKGQSPEVIAQELHELGKRLGSAESAAAANQVRIQMIQEDVRDVKYGLGALGLMMATGLFAEFVRAVRHKKAE